MEKVEKIYAIIRIAIVILIVVVVGVCSGKENEKDTSRTVSAKEVESTTIIETANAETVKVDKVAAEQTTEEPTTEQVVELYDVPLEEQLQHYIINLCEKKNIAPALVMAIIERESKYDPLAKGDSGNSLGLMQIQPKWHQWRADELGCLDWFNPYDNVTVGIDILADLFAKHGDDVYMVLMAYNGGNSYAYRMQEKGKVSEYAIEVDARAEELEKIMEEQK